jgi:branched-chain amino acid transport system substrate-binding protein
MVRSSSVHGVTRRQALLGAAVSALPGFPRAQLAAEAGVSKSEIRLGQTHPLSGPLSALASIGKGSAAYFQMVNDKGGIGGRKISLIARDDSFQPPKTVEMTRELVEQEQVFMIFGQFGTATAGAVQKYLNAKGIPQLFVGSGGGRFYDPRNSPWSTSLLPAFESEGVVVAQHINSHQPGKRIGVLFQNDDFGRDYLRGFWRGLGTNRSNLVAQASYEVSDPTINSQLVLLRESGAEVFMNISQGKFAVMSIRRNAETGWKPVHYLQSGASSIGGILRPAGIDNARGMMSTQYMKDVVDPRWKDDPGVIEYLAFFKRYLPGADINDVFYPYGYTIAQLLTMYLTRCGEALSRRRLMDVATSAKNLELPLMLPGVKVSYSPDDYRGIRQMAMSQFDGTTWAHDGKLISE